MPQVTVTADVEFWCAQCGKGICSNFSERPRRPGVFDAEPCADCLEAAKNEGVEEGRAERQDEIDSLQERVRELEQALQEKAA